MKRIKNTISMIKGLEKDTLEGIRYTIIFFIVIDMVLFYWFMKWKQFSIALMVFCLIALTIILLLERKFPPEKDEEKTNNENNNKPKLSPVMNPIKKEPQTVETPLGIMENMGLPNSDEFNERLEKAVTS